MGTRLHVTSGTAVTGDVQSTSNLHTGAYSSV